MKTSNFDLAKTVFPVALGIIAFGGLAVLGLSAGRQSPAQSAETRPQFEAVSIKPTAPGTRGSFGRVLPSGRLESKNVTLKYMMTVAYSVTNYQIVGSADLLEDQKYDVIAEAGHTADTAQLRLMLKSALEDILKLKVHNETRELPIYSLVLAKPGVRGGPSLVEDPNGDCAATSGAAADAANPANPGVPIGQCGSVGLSPVLGRINGRRGRILQLVDRLSTVLGRTVVDNTGLTANYDITLTWTPDPTELPAGASVPPGVDPMGPDIFTAVQEQLGLKLVAGKGPVEVIVVDSALKLPQQ